MLEERIITVEYLVPSMSQTLLCKFPDTSSFGFNYSESGIWSPLLPRGSRTSTGSDTCHRSSDKFTRLKCMSMKKKKKKMMIINKINMKLDFSPTPTRGWKRVLKAAARRFKVQRRAAIQMILPTM